MELPNDYSHFQQVDQDQPVQPKTTPYWFVGNFYKFLTPAGERILREMHIDAWKQEL